jgi:N-acyl-D-amino-acid deacylase
VIAVIVPPSVTPRFEPCTAEPGSAMIRQAFDLLLRNGTVVDGSGGPAFRADVAIRGDRIAAIGHLREVTAGSEIDISGLIVAPGFIDVHTHDDAALILRPQMLPKLTQGVTTVIAGNCGISGAPYSKPGSPPDLMRIVFKSNRCVAPTLDQYLQRLSDAEPAVNAAFLTGHTALRMQVMGEDLKRAASEDEIAGMRDLLEDCLEQGSLGLSTGLFYPPARAASTQEVIGVARPLREHQGLYVTHMRDEADGVLESIAETLVIGREVGANVIISHHKCMGQRNFGRSVETLARLEEARQSQAVAWDVYPYTAASSILHSDFVEQSSKTLITWCDPYPEFSGCELGAAAQVLGCTPAEAIAKLQPAGAVYFMMDEADVIRILTSTMAMVGSDGLPDDSHPHPRLWGTFPRVFRRYVREQKVLSLENAVHRMTGLSAECFGLRDRGQIRVGFYADVTVFDAQEIGDAATFDEPARPATGIRHVLVNGKLALTQGTPTTYRPGKILRRGY